MFKRSFLLSVFCVLLFQAGIINAQAQGQPAAPKSGAANTAVKPKSPGTASFLAFLIPSAGHGYAGNWSRGVPFALGRVGFGVLALTAGISENTDTQVIPLFNGSITVTTITREPNGVYYASLVGAGALMIWEMVDAAKTAKRHNATLQEQNGLKLGLASNPQGQWQLQVSYVF